MMVFEIVFKHLIQSL